MFLSAGHSTVDPGAIGFGRKEADVAEEFRNLVSFCLTDMGVTHAVDGRGTENTPLVDAISVAKKHRVALEFHCNAGPPAATGVEVLCAEKDQALSIRLCSSISNALGIRNRGVKPENSGQHQRLGFIRAGGIIVELFFISNRQDLEKYDANKLRAARAVAEVLRAAA